MDLCGLSKSCRSGVLFDSYHNRVGIGGCLPDYCLVEIVPIKKGEGGVETKKAVSQPCDTASLYTLRGSNPGPTD